MAKLSLGKIERLQETNAAALCQEAGLRKGTRFEMVARLAVHLHPDVIASQPAAAAAAAPAPAPAQLPASSSTGSQPKPPPIRPEEVDDVMFSPVRPKRRRVAEDEAPGALPPPAAADAVAQVIQGLDESRKDELVLEHARLQAPQQYNAMLRAAVERLPADQRCAERADVYCPRLTSRSSAIWRLPYGKFYLLRSEPGHAFCSICCPLLPGGRQASPRANWDLRGVKPFGTSQNTRNLCDHAKTHDVVVGRGAVADRPPYEEGLQGQIREVLVPAFQVMSLLPLLLFESQPIVAALQAINPRIDPPSYEQVCHCLKSLDDKHLEKMKSMLAEVRCGQPMCCAELDCWEAPTGDTYFGFIVHGLSATQLRYLRQPDRQ